MVVDVIVNCVTNDTFALYITDNTTTDDIVRAYQSGMVYACKLYPAGATTNSEFGVTSIDKIKPIIQVDRREL